MNKVSKTTTNSHDNNQKEFPCRLRMIFPPDLHQIQPRATQVWSCDKIMFEPNGKRHKVVSTYKFFRGGIMWKVQTGECAPFRCTLLVFTRSECKCFIHPIVVHQSKEYIEDLHQNTPLDRTFHHTQYGHMDRDWWLKAMTQFSNIWGASPVNNQIIFFDGHDSHFGNRTQT